MRSQERLERDKQRFKEKLDNLYWKKDKQWYQWFQQHPDETFKEIPGYAGLYFISTYGRVISFHFSDPREMVPRKKALEYAINLFLRKRGKLHTIPDLVYRTFHGPLPDGWAVEHINGDIRDNHYKNLRKCKISRLRLLVEEELPPPPPRKPRRKKGVLQFDLHGRFIREFPSVRDAAAAVNLSRPESLHACLRGEARISGGFQWKWRKDPRFKKGITNIEPVREKKFLWRGEVLQFSVEGKFLYRFESIYAAAEAVGCGIDPIINSIRGRTMTGASYQWRSLLDPEFKNGIHDIPPAINKNPKAHRPVTKYNRAGEIIAVYESIKAAVRADGHGWLFIKAHTGKNSVPDAPFYYEIAPPAYQPAPGTPKPEVKPARTCHEILQFDFDGRFIASYPSIKAAAAAIGVPAASIKKAPGHSYKISEQYLWYYRDEPFFNKGIRNLDLAELPPMIKGVLLFSLEGKYLRKFRTLREVTREFHVSHGSIAKHLKGEQNTVKGYQLRLGSDPIFRDGIVDIPPVEPDPDIDPKAKKVLQFDIYGHFIREYPSATAAARAIGASNGTLSHVLGKEGRITHGYQWRYRDDPRFKDGITGIGPLYRKGKRLPVDLPVLQFDLQGKFLRQYPNTEAAAVALGAARGTITSCVAGFKRTSLGFLWRSIADPYFKDGIRDIPPFTEPFVKSSLAVLKFDRQDRLVAEFQTIKAAAKDLGVTVRVMERILRGSIPPGSKYYWTTKKEHPKYLKPPKKGTG